MSATLPADRYSAEVVLSLVVGDRTIRLSQVAPDFVILAEPVEIPPCPAEIHVNVDGNVHRRTVYLVDGIQTLNDRVRVMAHAAK